MVLLRAAISWMGFGCRCGVFTGIGMQFIRRTVVVAIGVAAILQWGVVVERVFVTAWTWYKFLGYGSEKYTVAGQTTQTIFLIGSFLVSCLGYVAYRVEVKYEKMSFWRWLSKVAWMSVAICTLIWICFLASPLIKFYKDWGV